VLKVWQWSEQKQVKKILGNVKADGFWHDITIEKVNKLKAARLGSMSGMHDRGATEEAIVALLEKHPDLRATAFASSAGNVVLNGFDVTKSTYFKPETVRDFFEFAFTYADSFTVMPRHLFMWFD